MPSRVFNSNSGLIHQDSLACWTAADVIQDLRKLAGCDVNLPLLRRAQFARVCADGPAASAAVSEPSMGYSG